MMYVPPAFEESDPTKLFDFIEANSFGLLVSHLKKELYASHLPLVLNRGIEPSGQLTGHMARANPQWREISGQDVLTVFSGPHAYISPTWYQAENVVPTWNFVAVQVYGKCEVLDDERATAQILEDYVSTYERRMPSPWLIDPTTAFFRKMAKMVVAFRINIRRIEGKWKLGQNHPAERREKVARKLAESEDFNSREIARLMAQGIGN
jgi:transcriptional regulator